jgi:hypothetical protein
MAASAESAGSVADSLRQIDSNAKSWPAKVIKQPAPQTSVASLWQKHYQTTNSSKQFIHICQSSPISPGTGRFSRHFPISGEFDHVKNRLGQLLLHRPQQRLAPQALLRFV